MLYHAIHKPVWRNGIRACLKNKSPYGVEGSNLSTGTYPTSLNVLSHFFPGPRRFYYCRTRPDVATDVATTDFHRADDNHLLRYGKPDRLSQRRAWGYGFILGASSAYPSANRSSRPVKLLVFAGTLDMHIRYTLLN